MSSFDIKFRGLDEYDGKLGRIEGKLPVELKRLMTKGVVYAQGEIPSYPPAAAGSTYRRTGTLGRVVTAFPGVSGGRNLGGEGQGEGGTPLSRVEMMGRDVKGVVGGRLSYLPGVVGEAQEPPFRGRWWQLKKVIVGARDGIVKIFRAGVVELFNQG